MDIAIDSAQKRYSALTDNQIYMPAAVPDGSIGQDSRQAASHSYSGILAQTLAISGGSEFNMSNAIHLLFRD